MTFSFFIFLLYFSFSFNPLKFVNLDGEPSFGDSITLTFNSFPKVKKLKNNKYLALDSKGIFLIDKNFQSIEKQIISVTFSSYNGRSANIVEFDDLIIVINENNLYILSQDGNVLVNKEETTFIKNNNFYNIIPYNKEDNKYIFYITYFDINSDKKLKYNKCTYESSTVNLATSVTLNLNYIESTFYNIDCFLLENNNKKIIGCFYANNDIYYLCSLDPDNELQLIEEKSCELPVVKTTQRYIVKTLVMPGNQRVICCAYSKNDLFDCAWYDITTNKFNDYFNTEIKGGDFYAYNIYKEYFEETYEVLIGKTINKNSISTIKCSKELECSTPKTQTLSVITQYMSRVNVLLLKNDFNTNKYYAIANDYSNPSGTFKFELNLELGLTCQNYYNLDRTSCLKTVPDGFYCNNSDAKTITQCDSKCSKCDKESIDNNKCISCNNDNEYYPKYNEKDNEYKTCYSKDSKFEGLYLNLENKVFEQCFYLCKNCLELGDETNNKCEECISGYQFNSLVNKKNNCYKQCDSYNLCCDNIQNYLPFKNKDQLYLKIFRLK